MYKIIFTIYNNLFSCFDQLRFRIYEVIRLRIERNKYNAIIFKKNPSIDIILPTYNRSKMLKERSIPSILRQTYKNFRLIIIGDCCTDDTRKVVESFNDSRIFFIIFCFKFRMLIYSFLYINKLLLSIFLLILGNA